MATEAEMQSLWMQNWDAENQSVDRSPILVGNTSESLNDAYEHGKAACWEIVKALNVQAYPFPAPTPAGLLSPTPHEFLCVGRTLGLGDDDSADHAYALLMSYCEHTKEETGQDSANTFETTLEEAMQTWKGAAKVTCLRSLTSIQEVFTEQKENALSLAKCITAYRTTVHATQSNLARLVAELKNWVHAKKQEIAASSHTPTWLQVVNLASDAVNFVEGLATGDPGQLAGAISDIAQNAYDASHQDDIAGTGWADAVGSYFGATKQARHSFGQQLRSGSATAGYETTRSLVDAALTSAEGTTSKISDLFRHKDSVDTKPEDIRGFHIDIATMKAAIAAIFDDPRDGIIAKLTQVAGTFEKTGQPYYTFWQGTNGTPATTQLPTINGTMIFGGPLGNGLDTSWGSEPDGYGTELDSMIGTFDRAVEVFVKNQHGLIAALREFRQQLTEAIDLYEHIDTTIAHSFTAIHSS